MSILRFLPASALMMLAALAVGSLQAQTVFDDSFADGDRAQTNTGGEEDTSWWTSSSSDGIEASVGSLGLVTGASGRGIHTVFPTQTLGVGDTLTATFTFTTPTTVAAVGATSSFRVGLFDSLERAGLDADVAASSLPGPPGPNALYGWSVANGGTGEAGLPGYMLDMDVNTGPTADFNFRVHDTGDATGQLMGTVTGFTSFPSGPDAGYTFDPNTTYTVTISATLISASSLRLVVSMGDDVFVVIDETPTTEFGFLGFHVNSGQFGLNSLPGEADNGIDFSNIKVEFTPAPVIVTATVFDDSFADGDRAETNTGGENDTSWWHSSWPLGIELNLGMPNTLGLVSGTSGRGIHTVFPLHDLANVGDKLTATYTFTTPATVGAGGSASFRIGLFDTLGRAGLNGDITATSSMPSPLYGDIGVGGTEVGVPGYMLDMDVNTGPAADLSFRVHNVDFASGRLLGTTSGGSYTQIASSPDLGYTFAASTTYSGSYCIERITPSVLLLTGELDGNSFSVADASFTSSTFGLFGFHANSNMFGSINEPDMPDNGIDFTNIAITFSSVQTVVLGDANDDGVFDNLDIAAFVLALTDAKAYALMFPNVDVDLQLDMDGSGMFNNKDIAAFVAALTGP